MFLLATFANPLNSTVPIKIDTIVINKSIAKTFSKYGITSNTISPGIFPTNMTKKELKLPEVKSNIKNIPIKRIGKLTEISGIVNFLSSEDSSYITGQNINVNGGMFFS